MSKIKNETTQMNFSLIDPDLTIEVPAWNEGSQSNENSYVTWGTNNKFPNELTEIAQASSTLSSIINGTIATIIGEGYVPTPELEQKLTTTGYFNDKQELLEDLIEPLIRDHMLFGCFAIQVIYNKLHQVSGIYHLPMEYVRSNEHNTKFFYSKKFSKYSGKMLVYNKFDRAKAIENGEYTQVFFYKNSGSRSVYGITPQSGCLEDVVSESIAAKYVRKTLQSGLSARYIINIPSSANIPDEQKKKIEKGIREKFCGVNNSGNFMIYYNTTTDKLDIHKIDKDDSDEVFNSIRKSAKENIFICNHCVPTLFGDPSATTGFSEQEYTEALKLFRKMIIIPTLTKINNALCKIYDVKQAITLKNNNEVNE